MKKIYIITTIALILLIAVLVQKNNKPQTQAQQTIAEEKIKVQTRQAQDFQTLTETIQLPATIVGDQESSVIAQSSGIITAAPFSLGGYVNVGSLIARIDNQAGQLSSGENGFVNSQLQQSNLAIEQAEESYKAAKKNYTNLKDASATTKAQLDAAKAQRNLAELQLQNAKISYKGNLDNHLTTAPISGFVIAKPINIGDTVAPGQVLATISKTKALKIQFFVSAEHLPFVQKGLTVSIQDNNGNSTEAIIKAVSPVADPTTKRFLIEAFPKTDSVSQLYSGTVTSVSFEINEKPQAPSALILPLSILTVGQNESFVFVEKDGIASQLKVEILRVDGEFAEVQGDFQPQTKIITQGNSFLKEGSQIIQAN